MLLDFSLNKVTIFTNVTVCVFLTLLVTNKKTIIFKVKKNYTFVHRNY